MAATHATTLPQTLLAWAREWLRPKPPNAAWAERISEQTLSIADFTRVLYTCTPDHLHAWARWLTDQACESLTPYSSSVDQVRTLASPSPSSSPSTLALALASIFTPHRGPLTFTRYPHPLPSSSLLCRLYSESHTIAPFTAIPRLSGSRASGLECSPATTLMRSGGQIAWLIRCWHTRCRAMPRTSHAQCVSMTVTG